jgi:hypothetical protein
MLSRAALRSTVPPSIATSTPADLLDARKGIQEAVALPDLLAALQGQGAGAVSGDLLAALNGLKDAKAPPDLLAALESLGGVAAQRGTADLAHLAALLSAKTPAGTLPTLSLPSSRLTPLGGDGAALPSLLAALQTKGMMGTVIEHLEVNVTVPGGVASPELRTVTVEAVEEALQAIGLRQSGNTIQFRGMR